MKKTTHAFFVAIFFSGAAFSAPTPNATTSWEAAANSGHITGGYASDTSISVSSTHVAVVNQAVSFYEKSGALLYSATPYSFFLNKTTVPGTSAGLDTYFPDKSRCGDIRSVFDFYRNRFWIVTECNVSIPPTMTTPGIYANHFAVAVSKTSNPLDGWWSYDLPGSANLHADDAQDFVTAAVGPYTLSVTANIEYRDSANNAQHYAYAIVADVIKMASGLDPSTFLGVYPNGSSRQISRFTKPDGTDVTWVQPVHSIGSVPQNMVFFASDQGNNNDQIYIWALPNSTYLGFSTAPITPFVVPRPFSWISPLGSVNQKQNSALPTHQPVDVGSNEFGGLFFRNNKIYLVETDGTLAGSSSTCAYSSYQTGKNFNTNLLIEIPVLRDGEPDPFHVTQFTTDCPRYPEFAPTTEFYSQSYGSVAVNSLGDVGLVSTATSPYRFSEARINALYHGETSFRDSSRIRQGETEYYSSPDPIMRWGDFSGSSVDPFDDTAIWFANQFAKADPGCPADLSMSCNNYGIQVAKLWGTQHPDLLTTLVGVHGTFYRGTGVSLYRGASFLMDFKVKNQGDGATTATVPATVYFSTDKNITKDDYPVGLSVGIPGLASGATSYVQNFSVYLPSNFPTGPYYVGVIADPNGVLAGSTPEYSTDNNLGQNNGNPLIGLPFVTVY
jgi:hypothetical protein